MKHYINNQIGPYQTEGEPLSPLDRRMTTPRPSPAHFPNADFSAWVLDAAVEKMQNQDAIRKQIVDEVPYFALLVIHLVQKLLDKNVIAVTDFSQEDRDEFQKLKTKATNYLNL